ncbi:hypothetical protein GCM10027271_29060 [Saccharopolyspora gloriosae]|uniref:Uncharacterized protein n=1 Tax=Saccharopolyspora gloriosae TaxID=455344 RepID=A0A840NPP9_9PSEU|nr:MULTISPECIES: hypothetical protein [Saccharopolyspora]MBB5071259.1 hypothetical protein [Saccharopolyspora gloriosae]MCX2732935.1 hypothetical protein [Saccharopolyspora sp. NFXS83]
MNASLRRGLAASALVGTALLGSAATAVAAPQPAPEEDGVVIVDQPDTGDLHNKWTFAPLGIPVLGLLDSVAGVPGKLLPLP